MTQLWDPNEFRREGHLPQVLGVLPETFSEQRGIRLLDMCIRTPEQGFKVTADILQFMPALATAILHERQFDTINYIYITVDQKPVAPGVSQRREGWHSDAFLTDSMGRQVDLTEDMPINEGQRIERTYVAYDCMPTLFADGPWDIKGQSDVEALKSFDLQAVDGRPIYVWPAMQLMVMDPYCVHSVALNPTTETQERTFIKIQFSDHRYNREGNTLNPRLDYTGWDWVERRTGERAHRYGGEA